MSGYWLEVDATTGEAATGKKTGYFDNLAAAKSETKYLNQSVSEFRFFSEKYGERIEKIAEKTGKRLINPMLAVPDESQMDSVMVPSRMSQSSKIEEFEKEVDALRSEHPDLETYGNMLESMKDDAELLQSNAADVYKRSGFSGKIGSLVGSMGGAIEDPPVLLSMPFGSGASSGILRTAVTEGVIGGISQTLIEPKIQQFRGELGLEAGFKEGAVNVLMATGGGALFGGGAKAIEVLAGRALLTAFDAKVKKPTAEQKAARQVYEQIIEDTESSPFEKSGKAMREHMDRLQSSIKAVINGKMPEIKEMPSSKVVATGGNNLDGVIYSFDPDELAVDAKTYQFKEGGDEFGVTDRLKGVKQWDASKAGQIIVFENNQGQKFVADGHQRAGLAKRIKSEDSSQNVKLYGLIYREADGYTPEMTRTLAATKNIAEGTGSAVDAAKILRVTPEALGQLPPNSALVRHAVNLSKLSDDAFSMVVNEVVPENYAAIVGKLVNDPEQHLSILDVLAKTDPANATQAESIVRQALDAGFARETQTSLFGEETITASLFAERAKVLDKALKKLKSDRNVFNTLVANEGRIAEEGNVLARDANANRARIDAQAAHMVQQLANRKGSLSDALTEAARKAKENGKYTESVGDFVNAVRRSVEVGDFRGLESGAPGRIDEIEGQNRASLEDAATEETLALFDDPAGKGAQDQIRVLEREITELTAVGNQRVIPGAERISDKELIERKADQKIRPKIQQKSADEGLFDLDARDQQDFFDMEVPVGEAVDVDGNVIPVTMTVREMLDDMEADDLDLQAIGGCSI